MKGENAIGTGDDFVTTFSQHGACGQPMVLIGKKNERVPLSPDQYLYMENVPDDKCWDAMVETWQCPCGCTKFRREL